jgi:hypothetical protein
VSKKKVKVANSLDRALGNLKDIHEERSEEARAAENKVEDDRKRAEETAAREALEREAAAVRSKREEELGAEQKRVLSAREERARVEAATAAERERLAATLDAERANKETELAHEERRRRFPPWAIWASVFAAVVVAGLVAFGIYQSQKTEKAEAEAKAAIRRAEELDVQRADVAQRLETATARLDTAQSDAERRMAQEELALIRKEARRLEEEKAKEGAAAQERRRILCQKARDQVAAERKGGVKVTEADTSSSLGGLNEHGESKAEKQVKLYCSP